jgi:plasmid maintenance system antidote protein VapI
MARKKLRDPIHPGEIPFEESMKPMSIGINRLARTIGTNSDPKPDT